MVDDVEVAPPDGLRREDRRVDKAMRRSGAQLRRDGPGKTGHDPVSTWCPPQSCRHGPPSVLLGMTKHAKIAISLPQNDLADLDRLAETLDRSRSWVVAEAIRRLVSSQRGDVGASLDPQRREQIRRDLALTPTARVRAAEEPYVLDGPNLREATPVRRFATYDEFVTWRRLHGSR